MRIWGLKGLFALCAAGCATTLCLDASAGDAATATMLFNEAKRLAGEGKFAEACPKFEESQRLDPGVGTQFNLADCYEKSGRTATAWATFMDVAAALRASGDARREKVARDRIAVLETQLSKLTILAPKNVTGLEVRRNGEPLGGAVWGNAIPVDPGSYTIEASAPGKKKWSSVASVGPNGASVTVTIPELVGADSTESPVGPPPTTQEAGKPPATDGSAAQIDTTSSGGGLSSQQTIGIVAGGAGVVALGLGAVFGLQAMSKHSDQASHCQGEICDAQGVKLHDDASSAATMSTIFMGAGIALAGAGVVLFVTAPKRAAPSTGASIRLAPSVGPNARGMTVVGRF